MRYNKNIGFDGIRLFDTNGNVVQFIEWNTRPFGDWSHPEEIPEGKQIIGLKVDEKFLKIGFSYWEMPPFVPGKTFT